MGNVNRRPTPQEMDKMKALVNQSMRDGAIGIASGLIYAPNMYETTDDLAELAKVAARSGGIYTSHIRGEGSNGVKAIEEAIAISGKAGLARTSCTSKFTARQTGDTWRRRSE